MTDETEPTRDREAGPWGTGLPHMAGDADPARLEAVTQRLRSAGPDKELSPRRAALKALADASRMLTDRMVATNAPDDVVVAATAEVLAAANRFENYAQETLYGFSEAANSGQREDPLFDHSPLIGIGNPLAPPMTLVEADDQLIVANVRFGQAYEGPPGCVHGGYVAAAFDELLGATQSLSGAPGMTGTLSVRYERPTPLMTDLRFEGRITGVERRKIFVKGACYAGDQLTATAEGIFISMQAGNFLNLLAEREARQEDQR